LVSPMLSPSPPLYRASRKDETAKEADVRKQPAATAHRPRPTDEENRERMLVGVPVSGRRLEAAGVSTMVLEAGDGPPIVLLHGGIETGGVYWAPVIAPLTKEHRVIVPDSPGLGASEPLDRLDAAAFSAWLADLIRSTCSQKPVLVAHSLNGSLAARFATEAAGGLIERLVLCGSPAIGRYHMPPGLILTAIRFSVRPTERNNARFAEWAFLDTARTRSRDPHWYDAFMAYGLSRGRNRDVKRTMRHLIKAGSKRIPDAGLRSIPVPVALIWGRHDRMVPIHLAEEAHRRFGWPLHVIEDAGHVPHIEQPDAFVNVLRAAIGAGTEGGAAADSRARSWR
jgi:pimeloyl-ACP methyl ester carboxylesterase